MRGTREIIRNPNSQSFRLIAWHESLRDVECVLGRASSQRISGEGDRWHYHEEMELTLFNRGMGTRFVGDHIGSFAAGELVLLGGNVPHYWHVNGGSGGLSIQWRFPAEHSFWTFPENRELAGLFKLAERGLRITGGARIEVERLMKEMVTREGCGRLATLMAILSSLMICSEGERQVLSRKVFSLDSESEYRWSIAESVSYLVAHFREEVRMEDVLALTGLSRATFCRQFKKHSGSTFSEFLNRLRIEEACRELAVSERKIVEIAIEAGFSQLSFFNRLFQRVLGCSPREYRRRAKLRETGSGVEQVRN